MAGTSLNQPIGFHQGYWLKDARSSSASNASFPSNSKSVIFARSPSSISIVIFTAPAMPSTGSTTGFTFTSGKNFFWYSRRMRPAAAAISASPYA